MYEEWSFYIYPTQPSLLDTEIDDDLIREPKRIKLFDSSDLTKSTYLWHLRLGHISLDRIKRLARDGPLQASAISSLPTCESCIEGKMTKRPFCDKGRRANELLELVHSYVCGPLSQHA